MTRHMVISEIDEAIARGTSGRRTEMLTHVTDLFVSGCDRYSDAEIALFDDVIIRLAAEIELEARTILAERLAILPKAPAGILRVLADDDAIEVARPVLSHSESLDEPTLVATARTQSQQHLLAIAERRAIGKAVTDVLVERGDRQVVLRVVANPGAVFSDRGFTILVQRANDDDAIAAGVGSRTEIPEHLFLKLLATASEAVRKKLEAENPRARREVSAVVAQVAERVGARLRGAPADFDAARALIQSLHAAGQLDEQRLAALAKGGRREETTIALSIICDLPEAIVIRAMDQERPELLTVFARAAGLSWDTMKAILRLRAGPHGLPPRDVDHALANFERLKQSTAQQLVSFHRVSQTRQAPA